MQEIGIGIVGLGEWARTVHIPNLLRLDSARIRALASRDDNRLQSTHDMIRDAGHPTQPRLYSDYTNLLSNPNVDAVVVCTLNSTHEEIALAALNAGKHVLCEKPLSFTPEGCSRVRAAAAAARRVFQVGLEIRYADVAAEMRNLLRSGIVGNPRMVHCLIWRDWGAPQGWRASDEATGGIHLELSIHYLDLIDWMVSGGDARIYTAGGKSLGTAITDHFWMTMSYDSGVLANLGLAIFAPAENVIPLEIVGDKGRIRGDIITGRVEVWLRDGIVRDVSPSRPPNYHFDGFPGSLESLASFLQCVATGSEPIAGIDAATRATALALAARASEESGLPVTVPDHK